MKKIVVYCIMMCSISAMACDVCGTSLTATNADIYPGVLSNFIGLRYNSATFHSHYDGIVVSNTKEFTSSLAIEGRVKIFKNFYCNGYLPFVWNIEEIDGFSFENNGIGDANLRLDYVVPFRDSSFKKENVLIFGAGAKLPTGNFTNIEGGAYTPRNLMTGTGSFDCILQSVFIKRWEKSGLLFNGSYVLNTLNSLQYKKGNITSVNASIFRNISLREFTFIPTLSAHFIDLRRDFDAQFNEFNSNSGGYIVSVGIGNTVVFKSFNLGTSIKIPVAQKLSSNNTKNNIQAEVSLRYNINK